MIFDMKEKSSVTGLYRKSGDKNISILHLSSSCKHMHLSFKSVCNREHKGVICNMTYKVP